MLLLQQQALSAGTAYFECPGCRDYILFCEEMSNMGIHIPLRLVSCPVLLTLRLQCWACPGTGSAAMALGCRMTVCPSFVEKLEADMGWMR